ncbi:MAG: hypothetical protein PGN16_04140 [Sphingomonas phyllosphaerae]|uniref:hypothetical protein n=1 Tax=Sphingomonas phyllosphaerae TaxID=257003 RepID=UPI002FFCDB58
MGEISDRFTEAFRDFSVAGLPASGAHDPVKSEIRAAGRLIDQRIAGAVAGIVYYSTGAARAADTARPVGTIGKAADEQDYYRREGAGWVVDNTVYSGLAAAVQPEIDQTAADIRGEVAVATESVAPSAQTIDLRSGTGSAVPANGATLIERVGAIVGLSIASGATGQGAYLNVIRTKGIEPSGLAGVRSRIDLSLAVSGNFNRTVTLTVYSFDPAGNASLLDPVGVVAYRMANGVLTLSGVYNIPANAVGFQLTATLASSTATSAVQTIELLSTSLGPAVSDNGLTRADLALDARERQLFAAVERDQRVYARQVLVTAPGQGGEFTTIKDAIAAVQPQAGPGSRVLLRIAPKPGAAAYAERSIVADYIDFVSATPELVYIDGSQPNNASPADITAYSTFDRLGDCYMERLHISAANVRYGAVHWDDPFSSGKLWKAKDCTFWHKGNEGARQYQISQGHDPDAFGTPYYIWRTVCAAGCGTWDDCHAEFYNSVFKSPAYPFAVHDQQNGPFGVKQSTLLFDACLVQPAVTVNPTTGAVTEGDPAGIGGMEFTTYGQRVTNRVILRNSDIRGKIDVTKPGTGTATRSRWIFDGEGNGPLTWNVPFAGGVAAVSRIL